MGEIRRLRGIIVEGGRTQFIPTGFHCFGYPVGEPCGLPQNNPTVFSLTLEATSLAKQRRLFKKSKVYSKTEVFNTVGTDVPDCVGNLLFSGEEKRSKKVVGTLATVSQAKAPGRNYKLLPALATNSPPDCLLNASRHPPYERSHLCDTNEIIRFKIQCLLFLKTTIGQPRTAVPTI